eukprot:SAG22_NODE_2801_length_2199_cov_2.029524_3_plen_129_part_00
MCGSLFFGGHIHIYQRFYPLRSGPYGPNASHPNNRPAGVDFDCASTEDGPEYVHGGLIANNTYTNPKYMATIVAGGPGDPEITPTTASDCAGNISAPDYDKEGRKGQDVGGVRTRPRPGAGRRRSSRS